MRALIKGRLAAQRYATRGKPLPASKVLISPDTFTETKQDSDGRFVSVLKKPITVELMDK